VQRIASGIETGAGVLVAAGLTVTRETPGDPRVIRHGAGSVPPLAG
jgi:hypothetical protein